MQRFVLQFAFKQTQAAARSIMVDARDDNHARELGTELLKNKEHPDQGIAEVYYFGSFRQLSKDERI